MPRGRPSSSSARSAGEAFTPSRWERSSQALRYWSTEEWDKAIEVLEGHLAQTPDNAGVHYNLACAKARAGRRDEALDRLARAVELQPTFAEYAPDGRRPRVDPRP